MASLESIIIPTKEEDLPHILCLFRIILLMLLPQLLGAVDKGSDESNLSILYGRGKMSVSSEHGSNVR